MIATHCWHPSDGAIANGLDGFNSDDDPPKYPCRCCWCGMKAQYQYERPFPYPDLRHHGPAWPAHRVVYWVDDDNCTGRRWQQL